MDRAAVLVDAGFLLQGAGSLCLETSSRTEIEVDHRGLVEWLEATVADHVDVPLLRMYWYDGALGGARRPEHQTIAGLRGVKVCLGRIVNGRQKGVDSLILRDLVTLAHNRAVSDIVVVGGDEDLHPGIVEAQDYGVRVVVAGIRSATTIPSQLLIQESDDYFELPKEQPAPFVHRTSETAERDARAMEEGAAFAEGWLYEADAEQVSRLAGDAPSIPTELDAKLLQTVADELGVGTLWEELKRSARRGFWSRVASHQGDPSPARADG